MSSPEPDYLILGAGMAGLTVGALLAHAGQRVQILDAHEHPGGYAHSFPMGEYLLCAQVHYIFGCEEGGAVRNLLRTLGLESEVRFVALDRDGFDHVVIGTERYRIPNGMARHRDRMRERFPESAAAIGRFFEVLSAVSGELDHLPGTPGLLDRLSAPFRFRHLLRYRHSTLQAVFDEFQLPRRVQAVLAGQAGDYLLPPAEVSFLLHVALVAGYDRGAWYPERHFGHFVDQLVQRIVAHPGCSVELGNEVTGLRVEGDRVAAVRTRSGRTFTGRRVISNIDPARTAALIEGAEPPAEWLQRLDYPYSCGSFTLYLGLRDLDLREHGFGRWNTWYYPHDDINAQYRAQLQAGDLSNPWLFVSTPSLHSAAPGLTPAGRSLLVAATACSHAQFQALKEEGELAYARYKLEVRERILDTLEARFVPGLRRHVALKVAGTPTTNERFVWAPEGNSYGAALTPENVGLSRIPFDTPYPNLFLVNATAGYPSVAGTVRSGQRCFEHLTRSTA